MTVRARKTRREISSELPAEATCSECGDTCTPVVVDFGIGPYERHGHKTNEVDLQVVSDCCEAECEDLG